MENEIWKDVEKALTEPYLHRFFEVLTKVGAHEKIFAVQAMDTTQFEEKLRAGNG
jgi:tRNA nucleotidyltransferase/poly(A) polymerase